MQKILPSLHALEAFMPVIKDETYLVNEILPRIAELSFYKGMELPVICKPSNQASVRRLVEENHYQLTEWAVPNIISGGYMLSSTDEAHRKASVAYTIELIKTAAECSVTYIGLPSGDDPGDSPGDHLRDEAKKALYASYCEISHAMADYKGVYFIFEPVDRYVHKKQLMGPIHEVVSWFAGLKKDCPNFYIHWDSAHEALAGIDLIESLEAALPYIAQFHICNCVTEPQHPYYGDYHIEVGRTPDFECWGYLTPEIAASILKKAALANTVAGVEHTHWALEIRSHTGDNLWEREKEIREFMIRAYELADLKFE